MAKVNVIKANADLMRLPGAKLFMDDNGQEWIMIPSVTPQEYEQNGKINPKNPCRIWSSVVKDGKDAGAEKRILSLDIVPYVGQHPEWGYSHLCKFYKNDPNVSKNDSVRQNIILGNCKEHSVEWKEDYDARTNHNRVAYNNNYQNNANKPQYNGYKQQTNQSNINNQSDDKVPF